MKVEPVSVRHSKDMVNREIVSLYATYAAGSWQHGNWQVLLPPPADPSSLFYRLSK